jgi:hypothetical protein
MKVIALMTGRNAMKIVWKGEKVIRPVQKTLRRMVIAELKLTLLTVVIKGKDRTKWVR